MSGTQMFMFELSLIGFFLVDVVLITSSCVISISHCGPIITKRIKQNN